VELAGIACRYKAGMIRLLAMESMMRTVEDFKKWYRDQLSAFDPTGTKSYDERVSFLTSLRPVRVYRQIDDAIVFTQEEMRAGEAFISVNWEMFQERKAAETKMKESATQH
jgi:hypothetical protein